MLPSAVGHIRSVSYFTCRSITEAYRTGPTFATRVLALKIYILPSGGIMHPHSLRPCALCRSCCKPRKLLPAPSHCVFNLQCLLLSIFVVLMDCLLQGSLH